jgi:hypothetical protein
MFARKRRLSLYRDRALQIDELLYWVMTTAEEERRANDASAPSGPAGHAGCFCQSRLDLATMACRAYVTVV